MPEEKDKKLKESKPEVSRRDFLKDAGLIIGGAALGGAALMGACSGKTVTVTGPTSTTTKNVTGTVTATTAITGPPGPQGPAGPAAPAFVMPVKVALTKGVVAVNERLCSGCMSCMYACTLYNDGVVASTLARIQLKAYSNDIFNTSSQSCLQCVDPQCMRYCPVGAIKVDANTGARVIDQNFCIGCQTCIQSCPYTPPRVRFDDVKKKATKCHLCNGTPACVEACPTGALSYVTNPDGIESGYVQPKGRI